VRVGPQKLEAEVRADLDDDQRLELARGKGQRRRGRGQRLLDEAVHEGHACEIRRRAPRWAARARPERLVWRAAAGDLGNGIDVVYGSPLKAQSSDVLDNHDAPPDGTRLAGAARRHPCPLNLGNLATVGPPLIVGVQPSDLVAIAQRVDVRIRRGEVEDDEALLLAWCAKEDGAELVLAFDKEALLGAVVAVEHDAYLRARAAHRAEERLGLLPPLAVEEEEAAHDLGAACVARGKRQIVELRKVA
jgi:hypothetical protein